MIAYEDLTLENIKRKNNGELIVKKNEVHFHFKIKLSDNYDSVVIFSNGAINRDKKNPPVYMRDSWRDQINSNCIFIDDPTIHNSSLSIGWGIGRPNHYYLDDISLIVRKILGIYGVLSEKSMYYGSSAGGTMSLLLGIKHEGSKVLVNNPQMRVDKFLSGRTIKDIREKFFSDYTEENFIEKFKDRISVPYALKVNGYSPKVIYMFNRLAYGDYGIQFKAFMEDMKEYDISLENFTIIMYNDKKLGHNPISKESSISFINIYLKDDQLWI